MGFEPTLLANPASGTDFTFTVGTGKSQVLRGISFQLNSSATVADRYVRLVVDSGSSLAIYYASENSVAQVASVLCQYSFALGVHPPTTAPPTNSTFRTFSLPNIVVKGGWRIYSQVAGIDSGDQIAQVSYQLQDVNTANADYI